jgi:hypothetical protein
MMYWKPTPTTYEQNPHFFYCCQRYILDPHINGQHPPFMNKIRIYFIVGNSIYWIHISMANTHPSIGKN